VGCGYQKFKSVENCWLFSTADRFSAAAISACAQHEAQGTSLAFLLPTIGLLAALRCYRTGHVDFTVAGLLALGFFFGASVGALYAVELPADTLKRLFRVLLIISVHMIFHHSEN